MVRRSDQPEETWKFMGHGICNSYSKSFGFNSATRDPDIIWQEVLKLFRNFLSSNSISPKDLRGIGIQLSKLEVHDTSKGIEKFLADKGKVARGSSSLTPSQIDPAVLRELPEEIQKEIELEMGVSSASTKADPCPTTSYDNLSYSQLDEEVLKELPKEMQEELWQQLRSSKSESRKRPPTAFDKLMSHQKQKPIKM